MSPRGENSPEQPSSNRKTRDRAFILPLVGLILFVPPVANIFQLDVRIAGIPFTALYLFVVWGLLIAGAAYLSRRLKDDRSSAGSPGRHSADE